MRFPTKSRGLAAFGWPRATRSPGIRSDGAFQILVWLLALFVLLAPGQSFAQRTVVNGSFEESAPPKVAGEYVLECSSAPRVVYIGSWGGYVPDDDVPGWNTTAPFSSFGFGVSCPSGAFSGDVIEFSRKAGNLA
jgi:hypothetical protein